MNDELGQNICSQLEILYIHWIWFSNWNEYAVNIP